MNKKAVLKKDYGVYKEGQILNSFYVQVGWLAFGNKKDWFSLGFVEGHPELFEIKED